MADTSNRRWLLFAGCGSLFFLSCCGCMVWAFFAGQANRTEFGDLEQACRGVPSSGTGPFPVPAPRAIGMSHDGDGRYSLDGFSAPDPIRASTRGEVNVVICTEPEVVVDDVGCSFSDIMMRTHTFTRNHRVVHARIVAAATGAPLFEGDIATRPPDCTLTSTGLVPDDGYVYAGDGVGRDDVTRWFQSWASTVH